MSQNIRLAVALSNQSWIDTLRNWLTIVELHPHLSGGEPDPTLVRTVKRAIKEEQKGLRELCESLSPEDAELLG